MLKPIHYIALVACISLHCVRANAQTSLGEKVITADAGLSLVGGAMDVIIGSGEEIDLDTNNNFFEINNSTISGGRALVLSFDYGLSDRWSIGGFVSTQRRHGSTDFTYQNTDSQLMTEQVDFNLRRNTFGFTTKIHYGKSPRADLYSGARMGVLFWNKTIESNSGQFDVFDDLLQTRPIFSLTVFGVRFYPTEQIGLNFELNLGAPNIIGLGAVVRIP